MKYRGVHLHLKGLPMLRRFFQLVVVLRLHGLLK